MKGTPRNDPWKLNKVNGKWVYHMPDPLGDLTPVTLSTNDYDEAYRKMSAAKSLYEHWMKNK